VKEAYYFGCQEGGGGHRLYTSGGGTCNREPAGFPCRTTTLDAGLLPPGSQKEGQATLVHLNGWTILAFWDRSIDSRSGSNSAFVFQGLMTFTEVCEQARLRFPEIWKRFNYTISILEYA
jgi:hypothetical protein